MTSGLASCSSVDADSQCCLGLQMKALSCQDPEQRSVLLEETERKDPMVRPASNINVAAILEKANAIRQVLLSLRTSYLQNFSVSNLYHC